MDFWQACRRSSDSARWSPRIAPASAMPRCGRLMPRLLSRIRPAGLNGKSVKLFLCDGACLGSVRRTSTSCGAIVKTRKVTAL